jgi:hypothetical protein
MGNQRLVHSKKIIKISKAKTEQTPTFVKKYNDYVLTVSASEIDAGKIMFISLSAEGLLPYQQMGYYNETT